jgi:hypothetical membrane protein
MTHITKIRYEYWGFAGFLTTFVGIIITAIGYEGSQGEPYSFLNHFISELGAYGISRLAWVFNTGLFIGGLFFIGYMWGLGTLIKSKAKRFAQIIGIYTALGAAFVGVFPMNSIIGHIFAANSFFMGGLILVTIFSILVAQKKVLMIPRWFSILGIVVAAIFVWFLALLFSMPSPQDAFGAEVLLNREEIWLFPITEWLVYFSIMLWILLLAIKTLKQSKNKDLIKANK